MTIYYVYAIFSGLHDRIYVGLTSDLKSRVKEHNSGRVKSTKHYVPWKLIHSEEYSTRVKARNREKRLKTSFGKKYLREVLLKCPCSSVG